MDSNTKKMLYYAGGAILVGAVAFFVYSFFKKDEIVVGNTSVMDIFIIERITRQQEKELYYY